LVPVLPTMVLFLTTMPLREAAPPSVIVAGGVLPPG
jgi:hypothetical protein